MRMPAGAMTNGESRSGNSKTTSPRQEYIFNHFSGIIFPIFLGGLFPGAHPHRFVQATARPQTTASKLSRPSSIHHPHQAPAKAYRTRARGILGKLDPVHT